MDLGKNSQTRGAFTLIELLVVITIIAILMGLLFPAFKGVQDQAKRTQAKNDLTQIVTAVNAFYTEYGSYPLDATNEQGHDTTFGVSSYQDQVLNVLRANGQGRDGPPDNMNPKRIPFISVPNAKDANNPRSGIVPDNATSNKGMWVDPWGTPYLIRIDGNYDNVLKNPYAQNTGAGPDTLNSAIIAWSFGKDTQSDSNTSRLDPGSGSGNKSDPNGTNYDDVISWQ